MSNDIPRSRALPANPDLEHLKNEAKERLALLRATSPDAQLAEAQFQLARDYGFPSWRALKDKVEGRGGELSAYVGFYRHDPAVIANSYYSVIQSDADLLVKHISGVKYELIPQADGCFIVPGLSLTHGFERDAAGHVRAMTIDDAGRHESLMRIDAATVRQIDAANAQARVEQRRPRTAIALTPDILDRHVGYYASSAGAAMEITREDAILYARLIGARRLPLSAETQDVFFYAQPADGGQFSFRVEAGKTVALIMHQSGVEHVMLRASAEEAAQASAQVTRRQEEQQMPRQPVSIPARISERYAGRYQITESRVITVTAEEGKLFAQITGQPNRFEIFPESATKFFWTVMTAQIEFYPDHDQRVSHAVFHTAGRLIPLTRLEDKEAA
jgi:hypothetical protein